MRRDIRLCHGGSALLLHFSSLKEDVYRPHSNLCKICWIDLALQHHALCINFLLPLPPQGRTDCSPDENYRDILKIMN